MVHKSLQAIKKISLWLLGIGIAMMSLFALIVQFWLLPNINLYKNNIAQALSDSLKQTVTISNISAGWHDFNPSISLENIVVMDAQMRPVLSLKKSDIVISWLSFIALEPRFADINIEAPHLEMQRLIDGSVWIAGIQVNGNDTNPEVMNWLLRQSAFHVHHAKLTWNDHLRQAPALEFQNVNIAVTSPPWKKLLKNHEVKITALPNIGTKSPIYLSADIYGNDIAKFRNWRGALHFSTQNTDIGAFIPWVDYPIDIERGHASLSGNVHFAKNQITAIDSSIELTQLLANIPNVWTAGKDHHSDELTNTTSPIMISSLLAHLDWTGDTKSKSPRTKDNGLSINKNDYVLSMKHVNLSFIQNIESIREANTNVIVRNGQIAQLEAKLDYANIDALVSHLSMFGLSQETQRNIQESALSGELSKLNVVWKPRKNASPLYSMTTDFKGLAVHVSPLTKIGFSGLDGRIHADQSTGKLSLASQNASFELKESLRWPILNNKLNGVLNWKTTPNIDPKKTAVIDFSTQAFTFENAHLIGKVNAMYRLDANLGDVIDLTARLDQVQAKYALFYYPISLGKDALLWLDTSILGGEINDINIIVKGAVSDVPFSKTTRAKATSDQIFKVSAQLKNAVIDYGKEWPKIEQLNASLIFESSRLEMNTTSGKMLDNDIIKSRIIVDALDADNPIVDITAEMKGSLPAGIKFMNTSPISKVTQGFTHHLISHGQAKLKLSLQVPLEHVDLGTYQGSYEIIDGSLQSAGIPTMTHVNGALLFTEKDLSANNMKAHIFGAPAAFNIATLADTSVRIAAKGILNETVLNQLVRNVSQYVTGSTQWIADILIKKHDIDIAIRSDLFGISSTLPSPLNKMVSERQSLRIDQKQLAHAVHTHVYFNNMLHISSTHQSHQLNGELAQLNLYFGEQKPTNGERFEKAKGLNISGELTRLNVDDWIEVNRQLNLFDMRQTPQDKIHLPIAKVDLNIDTLEIFDREIHGLNIQHQPGERGPQVSVRSQEIIGDVQWLTQSNNTSLTSPQANGKLIARLSHLIIPKDEDEVDSVEKKSSPIKREFYQIKQKYPALDITATNFELGNKKLGTLALNAYPKSENWIIQKLVLSNPDSILNVDGEWNNWANSPNTRLNIAWDIKNIGNTIKRFGYADAIKEGSGELTGQLSWPGSPHDFNSLGLNGNINFDFENGQILKVQPGVGRLLGLLSLQSLPRRLTLDFSDLFNSGFSFDKIKANVNIKDGVLKSDNFVMEGPAADVSIKGEASIPNETQSMLVRVNPRISDSVSLAALAGGPLVGAMAFLAQKILKDPLNKMISTEYMIGGTWDNPIELNENRNKTPIKPKNILQ